MAISNINTDFNMNDLPSLRELFYENPEKFSNIYFYKASSFIKEQKARIITERNAQSIICIQPDKVNPFDNFTFNTSNPAGFAYKCLIVTDDYRISEMNYGENTALKFKNLITREILIDQRVDFLQDSLYFLSFSDLAVNDINNDDIYLVQTTTVDLPTLVDKENDEQSVLNSIGLIPISKYNSSQNNSIVINKFNPISLNDIDITSFPNNLIFEMNIDTLVSQFQLFITSDIKGLEKRASTEVSIPYKIDNYIQSLLPIRLSFNQADESVQFTNEWQKFELSWDNAKKFINADNLEDLLTLKEIPTELITFNNVKIKELTTWGKMIKYNAEGSPSQVNAQLQVKNFYVKPENNLLSVENDPSPTNIRWEFLNQNNGSQGDGTKNVICESDFFMYKDKPDSIVSTLVLTPEEGSDIPLTGKIKYGERIYFDIINENPQGKQEEHLESVFGNEDFDINSKWIVDYSTNTLKCDYKASKDGHIFTMPPIKSSMSDVLFYMTQFRVSPDYLYKYLRVEVQANVNNKVIFNFLKTLLNYTINYRQGFPDRSYDEHGNAVNDMAKLHEEFQSAGTNPLEVISNKVKSFLALYPYLEDTDEWKYLKSSIIMLSRWIYSTYSLNNGLKQDAPIDLPYYFDLTTPAIKVDKGGKNGYLFQYPSIEVILRSKYFDLTKYNTNQFDGSIFINNKLSKNFIIKTEDKRVAFPFLAGNINEVNLTSSPQNYDIENLDYQKYLLYVILSISTPTTNQLLFDKYMKFSLTDFTNLFELREALIDLEPTWVDNLTTDGTLIGFPITLKPGDKLLAGELLAITINGDLNSEPTFNSDGTIIINGSE